MENLGCLDDARALRSHEEQQVRLQSLAACSSSLVDPEEVDKKGNGPLKNRTVEKS